MAIAGANSFAAENFGSDRSFVIKPGSITSSAPISSQSSKRSSDCASIQTISTGGTSIGSNPVGARQPDTLRFAKVKQAIGDFKSQHETYFKANWSACCAKVEEDVERLGEDALPLNNLRELAYEKMLTKWRDERVASSRITLPSQQVAVPVVSDASSARIAVEPSRSRPEPITMCAATGFNISDKSVTGPSSLRSYHSGISSSLESIDESPELVNQFENASDDVLGRKTTDDVVGDHSSLSRQGSERSMSSKRTSRSDLSLEDIYPRPSSETETVSVVVQPEKQAPKSRIPGAAANQDELTGTKRNLEIEVSLDLRERPPSWRSSTRLTPLLFGLTIRLPALLAS